MRAVLDQALIPRGQGRLAEPLYDQPSTGDWVSVFDAMARGPISNKLG